MAHVPLSLSPVPSDDEFLPYIYQIDELDKTTKSLEETVKQLDEYTKRLGDAAPP